jgi:hypothetical protein
MRRVTESAIGLTLLGLTVVFGAAGLVTGLFEVGDPLALYGAAIVTAIAAIALAQDEHHRNPGRWRWTEALLGRALVSLSILLEIVSFALAIGDSPARNLWFVLAVVVGLVGLTAVLDSHRLAVARAGEIPTRHLADGVLGAISAALGLGLGTIGFFSGYLNDPHAQFWLYGGVVFALLSVALMFDEQAHVVSQSRKRRSFSR